MSSRPLCNGSSRWVENERQNLSLTDRKETLRNDWETQGKLLAFDALGDFVLKLWGEAGTAPNVKAIVNAAPPHAEK